MPSSTDSLQPVETRHAGLVAVDGRTFPLESAAIEARAEGGVACTTLTQSYRNPHDEPLEVIYTLPLPADGAVLGYAIRFGERVIRGEVMKRREAAKAYEDALFEGRAAGLLEQDRDDTFTQRLGSLPAGQSARIEIQVLHPLAFVPAMNGASARWEYRFPTVVGVRYQGAPGRVPDAGRLDVDRDVEGGIPTRVALDLALADGPPEALAADSATHGIVCEPAEGVSRVRLQTGARLDRDVVVRWNAAAGEAGARLAEGRGLEGDDGRYGLLTLVPPALPPRGLARDVTILLDASGSMHGQPLAWAKRVIAGLLASLEPGDRFELLAFSNDVVRLTPKPLPGSEATVHRALHALDSVEAGGGTEMGSAIVEALRPLRDDSQRQVVLVSDGEIGFESEIVGEIVRKLPAGARVHAVGVGSAPNRTLLAGIARAGRGVEVIVSAESGLDEAVGRLRRATARPVLTEVSVGGTAVRATAPARPRDVMAGQPLVLALELAPEGGTVEVRARQAGAADLWVWHIAVPPVAAAASGTPIAVGALFGRETIADLELRAAAGDEERGRNDEGIEAAGLRHRIASRLTSLVAIAEEPAVDPRQPRRRERLPVEMPHGVSIEGAGLYLAGEIHQGLLGAAAYCGLRKTIIRHLPRPPAGDGMAALYLKHEPPIRGAQAPPRKEITVECRVLRRQGRLLILEFTVPLDGLELPAVRIGGTAVGGAPLEAEIVSGQSTGFGPHAAGIIVRLALRFVEGVVWPVFGPVTLSYPTRLPPEKQLGEVRLRFEVPA